MLQAYHRDGYAGFEKDAVAADALLATAPRPAIPARNSISAPIISTVRAASRRTMRKRSRCFANPASRLPAGAVQHRLDVRERPRRGEGLSTAMVWYQKLAEEDSPSGLRAVGWMYYNGWGVDKDVDKAIEYYKKASDLGDGNASWNLGQLNETGDGVPKNLDEAAAYYKKASEQGFKEAEADLKRLGMAN